MLYPIYIYINSYIPGLTHFIQKMYFVGVAQEERIAKFNYLECQQGLEIIENMSNSDMNSEILDRIQ